MECVASDANIAPATLAISHPAPYPAVQIAAANTTNGNISATSVSEHVASVNHSAAATTTICDYASNRVDARDVGANAVGVSECNRQGLVTSPFTASRTN